MFPQDRHRLTFGTSVFHSYVHNWPCQVEYSPRFNEGWGFSDGEGLERLWSFLSPLVGCLRYATRNHRLAALEHLIDFHNIQGIMRLSKLVCVGACSYWLTNMKTLYIVTWICHKHQAAEKRQKQSLEDLSALHKMVNPHLSLTGQPTIKYTNEFFKEQWRNQVSFQKSHTNSETERHERLAAFFERERMLKQLRYCDQLL